MARAATTSSLTRAASTGWLAMGQDDTITGDFPFLSGAGNDTVRGGAGDDTIRDFTGGGDVDQVFGGKGNDQIEVSDGDALDEVDCDPGKDVVYADPGDTVAGNCEKRIKHSCEADTRLILSAGGDGDGSEDDVRHDAGATWRPDSTRRDRRYVL
jgi:Ca2+-binding RTX toxin-like protein